MQEATQTKQVIEELSELEQIKFNAVLQSLRYGCTVTQAIQAAGFPRKTFYLRLQNHDTLRFMLIEAMSAAVRTMEDVVYCNGIQSLYDPRYQESAFRWLAANDPEKWGNKLSIKHFEGEMRAKSTEELLKESDAFMQRAKEAISIVQREPITIPGATAPGGDQQGIAETAADTTGAGEATIA